MATGGFSTDILSDETFDLVCTVCKNKGKNTEAVKYCTDCADYYCMTCVKVHDDVPLLKGHKILDQGKAKTGYRKHLPVVPTERCDSHGHKPVDMYCQNHENVGCAACMALEHRSCKDFFYIPEFIQTNVTTASTQDTKKKLESTEAILKKHLQNIEVEKQNVLKKKAESIDNIRKIRKEINKRLDEMERYSVAEIKDRYKAVIQQIEDTLEALRENKKDVTSAQDALASAGNNVSQVFVSIKKGISTVDKADKSLEDRRMGNQDNDIVFTPDHTMLRMLEELTSLGQITLKDNSEAHLRSTEQIKQDTLLQIKGTKNISVKIPSDTNRCDIFSSCFLSDGTIILGDFSNKKLKRLDSQNYSVRDHYVLPGKPWQVCPINNQEVAVSIFNWPELLFVNIGNKMTKNSTMKFYFNCYGLAYAGGILYVTDEKTKVYMYSLSGQKLKQFNVEKSIQTIIHGLAVSKDGSKIYAAVYNDGLLLLDNAGKVVKTLNNSTSSYAFDCYVTDRGSVLVCGYRSNNVLQFTPDGKLMGDVVKTENCQTVCCNQQMSRMIVGKEKNEIEVHDLI